MNLPEDILNFHNFFISKSDSDPDFIPLMSADDESAMESDDLPEEVPILPLRNTVLFPGVVIPITAGRDKSIKLLQEAQKTKGVIGIIAQRDMNDEDPTPSGLFGVGTLAKIIKLFKNARWKYYGYHPRQKKVCVR